MHNTNTQMSGTLPFAAPINGAESPTFAIAGHCRTFDAVAITTAAASWYDSYEGSGFTHP